MGRKSKYSKELKIEICKRYLNGEGSTYSLADEIGTNNISGLAGLHAALTWIEEIGIDSLYAREKRNREELIRCLENFDFIKIIGDTKNECVGIISAIIPDISSDSAGLIFQEHNVIVRSGLQCAPIAHEFLGTYPTGTIRFSTSYFTSEEDFAELKNVLLEIADELWGVKINELTES